MALARGSIVAGVQACSGISCRAAIAAARESGVRALEDLARQQIERHGCRAASMQARSRRPPACADLSSPPSSAATGSNNASRSRIRLPEMRHAAEELHQVAVARRRGLPGRRRIRVGDHHPAVRASQDQRSAGFSRRPAPASRAAALDIGRLTQQDTEQALAVRSVGVFGGDLGQRVEEHAGGIARSIFAIAATASHETAGPCPCASGWRNRSAGT